MLSKKSILPADIDAAKSMIRYSHLSQVDAVRPGELHVDQLGVDLATTIDHPNLKCPTVLTVHTVLSLS